MAQGKEQGTYQGKDVLVTFRASTEEAGMLKSIADKSGIKISAVIRDLIFKEIPEMTKGMVYIFKLFKKYARKNFSPTEEEQEKFFDIMDIGEKISKLYKDE